MIHCLIDELNCHAYIYMLFKGVFVTPTDYTEPHNSFLIVLETLIFGLVGLILGRLIDSFFTKLSKNIKVKATRFYYLFFNSQ